MADRKWIYVLRSSGEDHRPFAARMRGEVSDQLMALEPTRLKLTVTEERPPKLAIFPFKKEPVAIFCVWDSKNDASRFVDVLRRAAPVVSGYEVEESTPVAYEKSWSDGEATPTPILLTMLRKKPGISVSEYMERWHNGHTPLSLKIHPLWYYVRNVIREPVTDDAAECDGIVEEACETRAALINPTIFYGGALKMVPNMLRVAKDINGFIDMKNIEVFYATEYHLRS